jgi:TusA-related sulfurtransferase
MAEPNILDLTGVPCPQNTARALLKMELLDEGEQMEIVMDDGESITNFLEALEFEPSYRIMEKYKKENLSSWRIIVKRVE